MMLRTHLAISVLAIIAFLPHVSSKGIFILIALIATALPDIDTGFSTIGKNGKIIQFFVKHRGIFHSLTFAIIISTILTFFSPILAFPFFLGYSLHLFTDSFTKEGIKPFWPLKQKSSWSIRVGGVVETTLFLVFVILDIIAFLLLVAI